MIELAGGVGLGLVTGWLLAQCLAVQLDRPVTVVAAVAGAAALVGETALLGGAASATGLQVASGAGAAVRIVFERAVILRVSR